MAPSTLSQTIRSLEQRLGVRLLHRTTRSVSVTEAGERLLVRIRPAFEELHGAVESIGYFRHTPTGTLRLSVSTVPAQMMLAPLLKRFMAEYPAINLDITVDNTTSDIVSGRFDAGIRYGRRIEQDMVVVRRAGIRAPLPSRHRNTWPRTERREPRRSCRLTPAFAFAWTRTRCCPGSLRGTRRRSPSPWAEPLIVNDVDLMVKAARDGIGIGYMLEGYVASDIESGRLVPLLADWSPAHHSYYLYYASRRQLPVPLEVFIEFLRESQR